MIWEAGEDRSTIHEDFQEIREQNLDSTKAS